MSRPLLIFELEGVLLNDAGGWIANPGALEALDESFRLAVVSAEAQQTAQVFAPGLAFICAANLQLAEEKVYYVGNTVEQALVARDARVPFIGITAPSSPSYLDLVFAFQDAGAYAIVDDINFLHEVFAS